MSAPAITIRLEFEGRPRVFCDYLHQDEEARMLDWLDRHPQHLELIERALEIASQERAA